MKSIRNRVSVIVVQDKKILGFHAEDPTTHQKYFFLPGGKIEDNESPEEAVIRETLEETGYKIRILPIAAIHAKYDFEWDGRINDCRTNFYAGELSPYEQTPPTVHDASYNLGVDWLSIDNVKNDFGYNDAILAAVLTLINQSDEKSKKIHEKL